MAYYLGIFGGEGTTNASAALTNGNKIIAFAEEERFNRIKNSPSHLPIKSIIFCLKKAKININKIKAIGFGWDCIHQTNNVDKIKKKIQSKFNSINNSYNRNLEKKFTLGLNYKKIRNELKWSLSRYNEKLGNKKITFIKHHLCHAASSFYVSGFKDSLIVVLDGMGEEMTGAIYLGKGEKIKVLKKFFLPNTLGGYYSTFTDFFGFKALSEEGKLMALAAYGKYSKKIQKKLNKFLTYDDVGNFSLNPNLRFSSNRNFSQRYSDTFVKIFGKPRLPGQKITKFHKNLAFNVQFRLEEIVKLLVRKHMRSNKQENLCLAGGVHMNCKLNGELSKLREVKNIFIQPASSDNGVSLGAAIILAKKHEAKKFTKLDNVYYGPEFSNKEILASIKEAKLNFRKSNNIFFETAKYLSNGKIVGWFQGRSEVGARALGNRSILANPMIGNMRYKLNKEVKHRELWRPFCPSVNDTHFKEYFKDCSDSPYMILALPVKEYYRKKFDSSVHIDGTARPQVVTKKSNIKYWKLIDQFGKITGHPILINTSFNIQGEPIVNTPSNAIRCFFGTGIDILVLNNFIITKKNY